MLGVGRPRERPAVLAVRVLNREEVLSAAPEPNRVKAFRDSHHLVARLFAMGLRPSEVAAKAGYTYQRVYQLYSDPSFKELVEHYRKMVDEGFKEALDAHFHYLSQNSLLAERMINDKLNDAKEDDFTIRELLSISRDGADRVGLGKRSTVTQVNVDFATKLDMAVKRSGKILEAQAESPKLVPSPGACDLPEPPTIDHE